MPRVEGGAADRPLALVVDRDPAVREHLHDLLEERAIAALGAATGPAALEQLRGRAIELLLLDPDTPGLERADVLAHALALAVAPLVIVLRDGVASDERAAEWTTAGVFDLMAKPLDDRRAGVALDRAVRQLELLAELRRLRRELCSREGFDRLVGRGPCMERLRTELERLAAVDRPVFVVGPDGSGKELVARNIHLGSPRASGPFVVLPCAQLGDGCTWLGRAAGTPGLLEAAWGGSVYLDGLTALPLEEQDGLLAALDGTVVPNVRLLASAPFAAAEAVERGLLVEELAQRLMPATLMVAPLCERVEDIPLLASHFARTIAEINHLPPIRFAAEAMAALEAYPWPGNVRELRHAVEHAAILTADGTVRPTDLPERVREGALGTPRGTLPTPSSRRPFRDAKREIVETFEEQYLRDLLRRHEGNVTSAAQQAGMLRSALQRLLRKYTLRSMDFRAQRRP